MSKLLQMAVVLVCLVGLVTPAWAHAPIMGIGGVFGGVLHALLIPEHGMSLLALGLVLGREQQGVRRLGEMIFVAALMAGLLAISFAFEQTFGGDVLIATTCILGLFMAAAWVPPPWISWIFAAITGLTFALDSPPEVTSMDEAIRMLIGSGLGAAIALVIVAEGSAWLRGDAPTMVMRVAGSWMAAIATLVLALRIVTRVAIG
jgi:hydrogenase/urease accessory protein HupE